MRNHWRAAIGIVAMGAVAAPVVWGAVDGLKAEVKPWRGAPTLFVHGKPMGPMAFRGGGEADLMRKIHGTGIRLYLVWWRMQPLRYGFKGLDNVIAGLLRSAPDARFIVLVRFAVDGEFADAHPEGTVRFNDGSRDHFVSPAAKLRPAGVPRYSFASEAWRAKAARSLHALISHVRQSRYDDRIVGYFIGAGHCGEWIWWCDFNHGRYDLDYSQTMQQAFRQFLRRKYGGSAKALRTAWGDDTISFDTATVPSLEQRHRFSIGDFYDPAKDVAVRDYAECHSAVVTDSILRLAKVAKEADGRRSVVGLFYGSLQCINYQWGGQADFMRVFDSPDVDFLASPFPYENRGIGDHAPFRALLGSLRLRNKLWFAEADDRTCFSEPFQRCYGAPDNLADSVEMLWRDFAHIAAANVQGWWTCFGPKWYDHADILAGFKRMQEISRTGLGRDRTSNSEIAVLIDRESLLTCDSKLSFLCVDRSRIHEWGRLGAMPDYFELSDLDRPELQRYKLYILPNAFSLSTGERQAIDRHLKRDGKVLVWLHAAGVIDPDATPAWSPEHCAKVVGMQLDCQRERLSADMAMVRTEHHAFAGLAAGMQFGSFTRAITSGPGITPYKPRQPKPVSLHPRFHVTDDRALVLARYVRGGQVGSAMRRFPDWTSVFVGSPAVPALLLRRLAQLAGVHLYLDTDDVVYHNASLLVVHTASAGVRDVRLPRPCDVIDARTGDRVAEGENRFRVHMPRRKTFVFDLSPSGGRNAGRP